MALIAEVWAPVDSATPKERIKEVIYQIFMNRYKYACSQCGQSCSKPPCGSAAGKKGTITDRDSRSLNGLGGWICPDHGKGIKVIRTMNKETN